MTGMQISVTQQFNVRVLLGSDTQNKILKDWCESTCKTKEVAWWASTGYERKFHWSANYKMQSLKKEIMPCLYVLTTEKHQCKNFLPFCSWSSQRWEWMELQPHVACTLCKLMHCRWYRRHWVHYVYTAEMHMHIQLNVFQTG